MSDLYTLLNEQAIEACDLYLSCTKKAGQDRPDAREYRDAARYHGRRFCAAMDALERVAASDTPYTAMRKAALDALRAVSDLMEPTEAADQLDQLYGTKVLSPTDRAEILAAYREIVIATRQLPVAYQWDGDR